MKLNSNQFLITIDIDWACEAAIEFTLDYLLSQNIKPAIFNTHHSSFIHKNMDLLEIGLHPFFGAGSSHGETIEQVVEHIQSLPYNISAYRCHRFAQCNQTNQAMSAIGMTISSNVCTDLELVAPFRNRFGLIEIPIFLEDGAFLFRQHALEIKGELAAKLDVEQLKVILIHPMHFAVNTPDFNYMVNIKKSLSYNAWNQMTKNDIKKIAWKGRGIRDLIQEVVRSGKQFIQLSNFISN